ncbi:uncharacterized protein LOC122659117 [Telopea speciosissima]|uniref:uncharacterized protein LOC122659117 n=1 Tax=Telopea speciosissima TaxID=54955 RepID=UPI001CC4937C|nr:uncharacterized protein LOC122659117 [Telopea speciosissima]
MGTDSDLNSSNTPIMQPIQNSHNGGNASSPYHLHHSDNPGTVLVSTPLNGDNYPTWWRAMHMALFAKNKMMFVDGSFPRPASPSSNTQQWDRCNFMVLSWLLNVVNPTIADSVIYAKMASSIWTDLEERYSRSNAPCIFQLKRLIATIQQGTDSLASYFTRLKVLWDELASCISAPSCACGIPGSLHSLVQQERIYQFLMGLLDSYASIRSQILSTDPLPEVNRAYHIILQEELQRSLSLPSTQLDTAAMAVNRSFQASQTLVNSRIVLPPLIPIAIVLFTITATSTTTNERHVDLSMDILLVIPSIVAPTLVTPTLVGLIIFVAIPS